MIEAGVDIGSSIFQGFEGIGPIRHQKFDLIAGFFSPKTPEIYEQTAGFAIDAELGEWRIVALTGNDQDIFQSGGYPFAFNFTAPAATAG